MASQKPLGVTGFNQLSDEVGMAMLHAVCPSALLGQRLLDARPFSDVGELLELADHILTELPTAEIERALEGHPRIGGKADNPSSAREQAAVSNAAREIRDQLADGNRAYEYRFGYVYLVFASGRTAEELLAILTSRLSNDPTTEWTVMLGELAKINRLRLTRLLDAPVDDSVTSHVSTHVLDAASGNPAAGVPVTLTGSDGSVLAEGHTDADGRLGDIGGGLVGAGIYRLTFDTGAYFSATGTAGFYPEIVIAFEITAGTAKYHVPVLLSPYAYSTYRGS